jgi:hypothetical protein
VFEAKKPKVEEVPMKEASPKIVPSPKEVVINTTVTKETEKISLDSSLESQSDLDAEPLKRKLEENGSDSFDEMKKKQKRKKQKRKKKKAILLKIILLLKQIETGW